MADPPMEAQNSCDGYGTSTTPTDAEVVPDRHRTGIRPSVVAVCALLLLIWGLAAVRHHHPLAHWSPTRSGISITPPLFKSTSHGRTLPYRSHRSTTRGPAATSQGTDFEDVKVGGINKEGRLIPMLTKPKMKIQTAEFVTSAARPDQFLLDNVPHFVFAGRSNVGKSSLLNALVKKKGLAKTSATPGKTRLINYFRINDDFLFVDVPGYGYAKVGQQAATKWRGLMNAYLKNTPWISTIFQLLDCRHDPSDLDDQMIAWLQHEGRPYKLILTKTDKLSNRQLQARIARFTEVLGIKREDVIPTSASSGAGMDTVLEHVYEAYQETMDLMRPEIDKPTFLQRGPVPQAVAMEAMGRLPDTATDEDDEDEGEEEEEEEGWNDDESDEPPIPVRVAM